MRRLVLLGLAGLAAAALLAGKLSADRLAGEISARTGAPLHLDAPMADPPDPRIAGTPPGPVKGKVALYALSRAMDAYPAALLRDAAPEVYIVGELRLAGYRIGGAALPGLVFLASDYLLRDAGMEYFRRAFHHEFSSVLIAKYPFPMKAWRARLPSDFAFPISEESQLEATARRADPEEMSRYHEAGFVSDYGASSLENDINTYAELLFEAPGELARLARSSPRIAAKTALIQGYYIGLHPDFAARFAEAGLPGLPVE